MPRILLLTSSFSDVYSATARNLRDALESHSRRDVFVENIDLLEECYGRMTHLNPALFRTTENSPLSEQDAEAHAHFLDSLSRMKQTLEVILTEMAPDLICVIHPIYHLVLNQLRGSGFFPSHLRSLSSPI